MPVNREKKMMNYRKINFCFILVAASISILFFDCRKKDSSESLGVTPETRDARVTASSGLRMHTLPDVKSETIVTIPYSSDVAILEEKNEILSIDGAEGRWTRVDYDGKSGWVFSAWLISGKDGTVGNVSEDDLVGLWLIDDIRENSVTNPSGITRYSTDIGGHDFYEFKNDGTYSSGIYATGCGEFGKWRLEEGRVFLTGKASTDGEDAAGLAPTDVNVVMTIKNASEYRIIEEEEGKEYSLYRWDSKFQQSLQNGDLQTISGVLSGGTPVDVRFAFDQTPLMLAIRYGQNETAEFLLKNGADMKLSDRYGLAAIHYAVEYGNLAILQELIDKGADVSVKDREGQTPLDFTYDMDSDRKEIVALLKSKGAVYGKIDGNE
jgi:hypothetical protein